MNLFERQITIDERATALTYQTSTISVGLSGLISKNYQLPLRQHLHLILIMAAQQIHLIDRLLHLHDRSNRISIIHRVFIGQARMIAGLWPQFHERVHWIFFQISSWNTHNTVAFFLMKRLIIHVIRYSGNLAKKLLNQQIEQKTTAL